MRRKQLSKRSKHIKKPSSNRVGCWRKIVVQFFHDSVVSRRKCQKQNPQTVPKNPQTCGLYSIISLRFLVVFSLGGGNSQVKTTYAPKTQLHKQFLSTNLLYTFNLQFKVLGSVSTLNVGYFFPVLSHIPLLLSINNCILWSPEAFRYFHSLHFMLKTSFDYLVLTIKLNTPFTDVLTSRHLGVGTDWTGLWSKGPGRRDWSSYDFGENDQSNVIKINDVTQCYL